jgi:hypothetical protein
MIRHGMKQQKRSDCRYEPSPHRLILSCFLIVLSAVGAPHYPCSV